ncbi:hypothetical protein H7849_16570 [Alloacidobacterium dinghuense]|uniref:Uncharacterized protein n=1 Tax=Alloacidobacterium dinghuense TaxID=2763107 RepID=A0A7G8BRP5_9BACT|nr:hypothetical protein [Alloacidobacterium dinghuense]QNI35215.1 hypothetical protein H7849_16570 [Alloacidobacterium dinghuense]
MRNVAFLPQGQLGNTTGFGLKTGITKDWLRQEVRVDEIKVTAAFASGLAHNEHENMRRPDR